jgi:hypothetical protein
MSGCERSLSAFVVAVAGSLGCDSFSHIEFRQRTSPPLETSLAFEGITIHAGTTVAAVAVPMDDDEQKEDETIVELEAINSGVLGVSRTAEGADEDAPPHTRWTFVLWGVAPGTTSVIVRIDEEEEAEIPATVVEQ